MMQVLLCHVLLAFKHVDAGYRPLNFGFFTLRFAVLTTEIDEIHTETPLGTCTLLLGAAPIVDPPFGAVATLGSLVARLVYRHQRTK